MIPKSYQVTHSYQLNDDILYIDVDGQTFTIDLLPEILNSILKELDLHDAEQIEKIQICRE